jgi:hypothetical protein
MDVDCLRAASRGATKGKTVTFYLGGAGRPDSKYMVVGYRGLWPRACRHAFKTLVCTGVPGEPWPRETPGPGHTQGPRKPGARAYPGFGKTRDAGIPGYARTPSAPGARGQPCPGTTRDPAYPWPGDEGVPGARWHLGSGYTRACSALASTTKPNPRHLPVSCHACISDCTMGPVWIALGADCPCPPDASLGVSLGAEPPE